MDDSLGKFSNLLKAGSAAIEKFDDFGDIDNYTCSIMMAHILACLGTLKSTMTNCKSFNSAEVVIFQEAVAALIRPKYSSPLPIECPQVQELLAFQKNFDLRSDQDYTPDNDDFIDPQPITWLPHFWAVTVPSLPVSLLEGLLVRDIRVASKGAPSIDYATILHVAAATSHNNVAVLQLIVQHYPEMAFSIDGNGELPLHFAARFSDSVEVIRYLLELHPEALTAKGHRGRTPLHMLACRLTSRQFSSLGLLDGAPYRQYRCRVYCGG
jgi:hypothetical protein